MGRQASNSATLPDGRVVGYGLIPPKQRTGYWRVRFAHAGKRVELSTGAVNKGEARNRASALIRDVFFPSSIQQEGVQWEEAIADVAATLKMRPATVESYKKAVRAFRKVCPSPAGPSDVTAEHAAYFVRKYNPSSANTVRNVLRHLSSLWRKHFIKSLKLVKLNPWADISPPPPVTSEVRAPDATAILELLNSLQERYPGWELLTLFVRAKLFLGCRSADLCGVESRCLRGGTLTFPAGLTKARTARTVPLPPNLFDALDRLKGETYLWERWSADAAHYRPNPNKKGPAPFTPRAIYWGIGNVFAEFNRSRPGKPRLRPHDLRRAALTEAARKYGVEAAARALGVDPQTARRYYIDGQKAYEVEQVYAGLGETFGRIGGDMVATVEIHSTTNGSITRES